MFTSSREKILAIVTEDFAIESNTRPLGFPKIFKLRFPPMAMRFSFKKTLCLAVILTISLCRYTTVVKANDDRFIKRYALMKLYETCFGPDVVKEVRKEMKLASAKCSGVMTSSMPSSSSTATNSNILKVLPSPLMSSILQANRQSTDAMFPTEHLKSHSTSGIDLNKLQQAILAGYNKQIAQNQFPNSAAALQNILQYSQYQQRPSWNSYSNNNGANAAAGAMPFYSQNGGLITPQPSGSAGYMPAAATISQAMNPFYQSSYFAPFYQNGRTTRDLDIKGQLESLALKISGKMRNVTCVMQELGYLDENLEPNYEKMISKIRLLPISEDLKRDMSDGVEYCKEFSLCVPNDGKEKITKEMVKPMFFFRCYKHKKLEACIMKDIRDRYTVDESEENLITMERSLKNTNRNTNNAASSSSSKDDVMELALYEFLYGNDDNDVDMFF